MEPRQSGLASEERKLRSFIHYQNLLKHRSPRSIRRVIDVGCGTPQYWRLWFQQGISAWGIQFSESQHQDPKRSGEATVVFAQARGMWPLANNFFDAATIIDIPILYTDPMPLISQVNRLLKKDGVLLIVISQKSDGLLEPGAEQEKYRKPEYWFGLIGGLGFHRVEMKQYFTYVFPPFTLFQRLFRTVGLPVQEYMVPTPSPKIARRYVFIAQN
jgi:SAM-dependent methyltransferase